MTLNMLPNPFPQTPPSKTNPEQLVPSIAVPHGPRPSAPKKKRPIGIIVGDVGAVGAVVNVGGLRIINSKNAFYRKRLYRIAKLQNDEFLQEAIIISPAPHRTVRSHDNPPKPKRNSANLLWLRIGIMSLVGVVGGCDNLPGAKEVVWSAGETKTNGSCEYTLVQASLGYLDGSQRGGVAMLIRNVSPELVRDCDYTVELYSGAGQELDDGLDVNSSMSPGGRDLRCTSEEVFKSVDVSGANLKVRLSGDDGSRPMFALRHLSAVSLDIHIKNLACPGEKTKRLF